MGEWIIPKQLLGTYIDIALAEGNFVKNVSKGYQNTSKTDHLCFSNSTNISKETIIIIQKYLDVQYIHHSMISNSNKKRKKLKKLNFQ